MKKKDIEESLRRTLHQVPDLDIKKLVNTPVSKMAEHDVITAQSDKQKSGQGRALKKGGE